MLEHPEIGWIEETGYPSDLQEDDRDQDAYDAYCDYRFEESRERRMFGDD